MSDNNDIIEAEWTEDGKNLPSTEVRDFTEVDAEFEYARNNLVKIIETSDEVLSNTAELVLESEHPRMVEVYSGLIKSLADVNKNILELREKKMKIKGELINTDPESGKVPRVVNNNAIFVGSTEELLQAIKG